MSEQDNSYYGRGTVYGAPLGVLMPRGSRTDDGRSVQDPVCVIESDGMRAIRERVHARARGAELARRFEKGEE